MKWTEKGLEAMGRKIAVYIFLFSFLFHGYEWDAIACLIDWFWDKMRAFKKQSREVLSLRCGDLMMRDVCDLCFYVFEAILQRKQSKQRCQREFDARQGVHTSSQWLAVMLGEVGAQASRPPTCTDDRMYLYLQRIQERSERS